MQQYDVRFLALVVAFALAVGCSSSSKSTAGPEQTLEQFYLELNAGNYRGAMALYGAEARRVLEDPATASAEGFAEWAKTETKGGGVEDVTVLERTDDDATHATVEYRLVYGDGSTVDRRVTLTLEDGAWKIGLIG